MILFLVKYVKNICMCFLHANVLFSDKAGKIQLALMSLPTHSKISEPT